MRILAKKIVYDERINRRETINKIAALPHRRLPLGFHTDQAVNRRIVGRVSFDEIWSMYNIVRGTFENGIEILSRGLRFLNYSFYQIFTGRIPIMPTGTGPEDKKSSVSVKH